MRTAGSMKGASLLVLLSVVLVTAGAVTGQEIEWVRQFGAVSPAGDGASAVDADGNVYVVGYVGGSLPGQTGSGYDEAFVRKYDANGNEVWTRQFGTSSYDHATGISVDAGDVYVAGLTWGTYPGQARAGKQDAFVRKYDASGTEIWTRQFGTSANDEAIGISVDAGGAYVVGRTDGTLPGQTSTGGTDAFVRKYDASGAEVWTRQFGTWTHDHAYGISVDAGGVYVAGWTYGIFPSQTSAPGPEADAFVRKYDSDGTELWTRQFGTSISCDDYAWGIAADAGAVYVAGSTWGSLPGQTNEGGFDAFVRKYDASGTEVWTRQFGTPSWEYEFCVISVDAGGIYVAGSTWGTFPGQTRLGGAGDWDVFVRKYDLDGTEDWTHQFGTISSDYAGGISVGAGDIYVVGRTGGTFPGQTSAGGYDAFVRKYDAAGTEVWTRQFGSGGPSNDLATAVDADGYVYVAGHTYAALPGQTSAGHYDVFVRKYDASGAELWTRQFGTSSADYALAISVDAEGVYVSGATAGTFPGQTRAGHRDAFVRKYDTSGTEVWTRQFGSSYEDNAYAVSASAEGVHVAGCTYGTLPGQTSAGQPGERDAFIRRLNPVDGTEVWTRQFGTLDRDEAFAVCDYGGGVYVAGLTRGILPGQSGAGGVDAFVRKYDSNGTEVWTRQFGNSQVNDAREISVDEGGVYVAGNTQGSLPGQTSTGGTDAFVRKYDAAGTEVWTRQFGSSDDEYLDGISVDAGLVYVAGVTLGTFPGQTSAGGRDAYVRKYDTDGNEVWTYQFGTPSDDHPYGISVDTGGVYVAGITGGTFPGQTSMGFWDAFVLKIVPVNNPPIAQAGGPYTVNEGSSVEVTATGEDPDGDPLTFAWDLDNDGTFETTRQSATFSAAELDDGTYTIVVEVKDDDNATATDEATVEVLNVAPTVSEITAPTDPVQVHTEMPVSADFTDPGLFDTHTALWDWGDNTTSPGTVTEAGGSGTVTGTHVYTAGGDYTVTLTVTDDDGGSAVSTLSLAINAPPEVEEGADQTSNEGETVSLALATFTDVNTGDTHTATVNWDDGTVEAGTVSEQGGSGSVSGEHVYADNGTYTVTVTVTDDRGGSGSSNLTMTVNNVAPTVGQIAAPTEPVAVGTEVEVSADFTDPGILDTHTGEWSWCDNTTSPGTVDELDGSGTVTGTHTYSAPGVYTVTLTVTDKDGGSGESVYRYVVVYDPTAGFVTGAGWIESPEGAYAPEPSITGKAHFGFVSRYRKGATTPSGNTQFNFQVADLRFQSTEYQWLVVGGPKAQFKGSGEINGEGNYGFMLTAIDGERNGGGGVDKFRIKIWDKAEPDEPIIYDNQMGDPDNADPDCAVGGGSIVIHDGEGGGGACSGDFGSPNLAVFDLSQNSPNPCYQMTDIRFQIPASAHTTLSVYDAAGRVVETLVDARLSAGSHHVTWETKEAPSGVYFYKLTSGRLSATRKLLILK